MPAILTRLAQAALADTVSTLYTVPADHALVDEALYVWNNDTDPRDVTVYFVPSGESTGPDFYIAKSYSIPGKQARLIQPKQRVDAGGLIRAFADTAAKVSIQLSGALVNTATDTTLVTRLVQLQLANALATIYTVTPASLVDENVWIYNFDTVPRTVSLQFIPNGQSPALDYQLLNEYLVPAASGLFLQPRQIVEVGGTIRACADAANKVTLAASGVQQ